MIIRIVRCSENNQSTTGEIHVDGKFVCHSLELPWRNNQSYVSSIPTGEYPARIRYDKADQWRVQLSNVPGRTGVQIHIGNYPSQIEGCVLTGTKVINKENKLEESAVAYLALKRAFYGSDSPSSTPDMDLFVEIAYHTGRTTFASSSAGTARYIYQKQAYWEELHANQPPNPISELHRDTTTIYAKYDRDPVALRIPLFGGNIQSKFGNGPWEIEKNVYRREN